MNCWHIPAGPDAALEMINAASEISELVSGLNSAFDQMSSLEPVWELSQELPEIGRAVIQIPVAPEFFDVFFNSPVGYRAMYRRGSWIGAATNAALVGSIRSAIMQLCGESVATNVIRLPGPEWLRREEIAGSTFVRSLDPSLSKVWYSTAEIQSSGNIRLLPTGMSDRTIDVGLVDHWREIKQDRGDCIIEIKGAFVGACGLFQFKDPEFRARTLSDRGEA